MDKHQLSKVLEILPDDFTFRAVIDEDFCDDLQDFYNNNIDEFIIYYKKIYKKGH